MLAEDEPLTQKAFKTELVFDTQLVAANALVSVPLTKHNSPSVPYYSQDGTSVRRMWLLPVVQASAMRPLTADQALTAAASGVSIVRASVARTAVSARS